MVAQSYWGLLVEVQWLFATNCLREFSMSWWLSLLVELVALAILNKPCYIGICNNPIGVFVCGYIKHKWVSDILKWITEWSISSCWVGNLYIEDNPIWKTIQIIWKVLDSWSIQSHVLLVHVINLHAWSQKCCLFSFNLVFASQFYCVWPAFFSIGLHNILSLP